MTQLSRPIAQEPAYLFITYVQKLALCLSHAPQQPPQRGGISLPPDFRTSGTSHLVHASRPRAEPRFCPREPHAEGERGVSVLGLLGRDLRGGIRGWSERGSSLATRSSELGLSSEEFAGHGVLRRQ